MNIEELNELKEDFLYQGWCVIPKIINHPEEIAKSIMDETLGCVFTEENDLKAIEEMKKDKIDPLWLLTHPNLRKKYLDEPDSIWHNKNPRTPKISRNCGMSNIYHNNLVRDRIL